MTRSRAALPDKSGIDPALTRLLSGYHTDNMAGRSGYRYFQQSEQTASSSSTFSQTQKPLPTITTTPLPGSTTSMVKQNGLPLSSISEKENVDDVPMLDGTELTPTKMPVQPDRSDVEQQGTSHNGKAVLQAALPVEPPAAVKGRRLNGSAMTSRTQSPDFSPISSNSNSYANTISPVSPPQPKEIVAQDGILMRSNLNGSWNRRARQGSVQKHVMSFMEYDTENESVCSSSRRSSLMVPGKSFLLGDQGRGVDAQDCSWLI